ncbi:hypothetical protein AVEN_102210-1 [Araneus ventricosus]|uniref:Uncharacterized protein n=1 Tax=Araneus ventricosus TaxID=182803 RepID=A0A4Y2NJA3_ARAVE|nr:hypothetical protein AVEN_102210-1 [Araneus ventricosus]
MAYKVRQPDLSVLKSYLYAKDYVILTSRFKATRRIFWDGPRNFVSRSDYEDDTCTCSPSPNFRTTPAGECLATTCDLACNRPHTRWILIGIGFRSWSPLPPEA